MNFRNANIHATLSEGWMCLDEANKEAVRGGLFFGGLWERSRAEPRKAGQVDCEERASSEGICLTGRKVRTSRDPPWGNSPALTGPQWPPCLVPKFQKNRIPVLPARAGAALKRLCQKGTEEPRSGGAATQRCPHAADPRNRKYLRAL